MPRPPKRKLIIVGIFIGLLLLTTGISLLLRKHVEAPSPAEQTKSSAQQKTATFNKKQYPVDEPSSLWVVVNKKRPLPSTYVPANLVTVGSQQLRKEAADQLNILLSDAKNAGQPMTVISGYRSYDKQVSTYNAYVQRDGAAAADTYSARAGHSEHQTGLAVDLGTASGSCALEICFADTGQGKWLTAHAAEYGFIIRYQKDNENRTGYQYEPWHIRYVGKDLAAELQKTNQTMEEFFGLPIALNY
jgi:D-alanyl-D-alanine carboxypeptidase